MNKMSVVEVATAADEVYGSGTEWNLKYFEDKQPQFHQLVRIAALCNKYTFILPVTFVV